MSSFELPSFEVVSKLNSVAAAAGAGTAISRFGTASSSALPPITCRAPGLLRCRLLLVRGRGRGAAPTRSSFFALVLPAALGFSSDSPNFPKLVCVSMNSSNVAYMCHICRVKSSPWTESSACGHKQRRTESHR
jgi:hypothetical protein